MEWQPIETAPKDGTKIDIWCIDADGAGWREPNAYYVKNQPYDEVVFDDKLGYVTWRSLGARRDGWWAPNHDYDGMDGFCDCPEFFNKHPKQMKLVFIKATHWMPLPTPPKEKP